LPKPPSKAGFVHIQRLLIWAAVMAHFEAADAVVARIMPAASVEPAGLIVDSFD
jgi:hypothetical protein